MPPDQRLSGPPDPRPSRTLTRGRRSRTLAGLLCTLVPVGVALGIIRTLAWLLAGRTPLARAPEWLAWGIATPVAAFVVFSIPIALLIILGRNDRG